MTAVRLRSDTYQGRNAYFICDECGQRWRRAEMHTRWDGLKVDWRCNDPRPPQMEPPDVYPEGMPFIDARPPQDNGDALVDQTHIWSAMGGMAITDGVTPTIPSGQKADVGSLSPRPILNTPTGQAGSSGFTLITQTGQTITTQTSQAIDTQGNIVTQSVYDSIATRTIRTGKVAAGDATIVIAGSKLVTETGLVITTQSGQAITLGNTPTPPLSPPIVTQSGLVVETHSGQAITTGGG